MIIALGTVWVQVFCLVGLFFPNNNNNGNEVLHMLGAFYRGVSNVLPKGGGGQITDENTKKVKRLSKAVHWQNWERKVRSE